MKLFYNRQYLLTEKLTWGGRERDVNGTIILKYILE
jgi:hypothetical protein